MAFDEISLVQKKIRKLKHMYKYKGWVHLTGLFWDCVVLFESSVANASCDAVVAINANRIIYKSF